MKYQGYKSPSALVLLLLSCLFGGVGSVNLVIAPVINGNVLPVDRPSLSWPYGKTLNLTCGIQEVQESLYQLTWLLPSQSVLNQSFVEIKSPKKSDSGAYECTASLKGSGKPLLRTQLLLDVWSDRGKDCGPGFFQCPNDKYCIGQRFVCDGRADCRDGADESEQECGFGDPCTGKLPCLNGRCLDPNLCCDPMIHTNCTFIISCCEALLDSNRHYIQYGHEIRFLHSTIYTIIGCVLAFIFILLLIAFALCRLQVKRGWTVRRTGGWNIRFDRHPGAHGHPPISRADIDLYIAYLQRVDSINGGGRINGIAYNVNSGGVVIGAPPPYSAAIAARNNPEPPPPYPEEQQDPSPPPRFNAANQARIITNQVHDDDDTSGTGDPAQPLLEENNNNDEGNNNGDINGNSDMVDHNEVRRRELEAIDDDDDAHAAGAEV